MKKTIPYILGIVFVYLFFLHDSIFNYSKYSREASRRSVIGKIDSVWIIEKPYLNGKNYIDTYTRYSFLNDEGKTLSNDERIKKDEVYPSSSDIAAILKLKKKENPKAKEIEVFIDDNFSNPTIIKPAPMLFIWMKLFAGISLIIFFVLKIKLALSPVRK